MKKLLFLVLLLMCSSAYAVCNNPDFCDIDYPDRDCSQDPTDYIIYNNTVGMGFPGYGTHKLGDIPHDLGHSFDVLKNTGMTLTLVNVMTGVGPSDAPFIGLWTGVHARNFGLTPMALVYDNKDSNFSSYTWEFNTRYNFTSYYNWVGDSYNLSFNNGAELVLGLGIWDHEVTPNELRLTECWDDDICYIDGFYMWNWTGDDKGCPIDEEETNPPEITLQDLSDTTPNEGDSITWTCNASDETALYIGWCSWNNSSSWADFDETSLSGTNDTWTCTNTVAASKGNTVGVRCLVNDTFHNTNNSTDSFTVANAAPVVTLVSPSPEDPYRAVNFNYTYQVSDADGIDDVDYCELWKDNGTGFVLNDTNTEVSEINYVPEIVKDNDVDDVNWTVKCYDNDSAEGLSANWTVYIDSKYPIPHFDYPKGDSSTNRSHSNNTFKLDVDVENDHLRFVNLEIRNPNSDLVHYNYSDELSDDPGEDHYNMSYFFSNSSWSLGIYTVYVNATDWANNEREWTITFEVYNTPPTAPTSVVFTSPDPAYSDSLLVCNASSSEDADGDYIYYHFEFKDSDNSSVLQSYSADNTFDCGSVSDCDRGDTIYCFAKAWDGLDFSEESSVQDSIYINNYLPTQDKPLLTSSEGTNYTNESLTCHNQSTYDADDDPVTNIFVWFKDGSAWNSLYLPFETNFSDYSGKSNTVSNYGANLTTGHVGKSSYFDGADYLEVADSSALDFTDEKSWELWFKRNNTNNEETLFDKSNGNGTNYKLRLKSDDKLEFSYIITGVDGGEFTWTTKTKPDFDQGTYSNTNWSADHVELSPSQSSGIYTSKIFPAASLSAWNNIDWTEEVPYEEELPDNQQVETVLGGANMTGNVLLMHLNENIDGSGYIMEDTSGTGNNGTTSGYLNCTLDGKFDKGCFSWGTGGHIEVNDDASFKPSSITISLWAKFNSLAGDRDLVSKVGTTDGQMGYVLYYSDTNDNIQFFIEIGTTNYNLLSNFKPTIGEWNLYTATYDGETQRIYIDGVEANSNSAPFGAMSHNNLDLHIGNRPDNTNNFNGYIDEAAIWNRGLSASEILDIYKRGILKLNLTVRSCDDSNCDNDAWNETYISSPQDLSVANNTYFQFKADFLTEDTSYSPELYNVTVDYTREGVEEQAISLTSNAVIDTNWHHAVVTFGSGENNFKMYIDNVLDKNRTETVLPQYKENDLFIGRNSSGSSYFTGNLDEFRIYNHVLSSEQISNNFGLGYDTIVSSETTRGESYVCNITPTDGYEDGVSDISDSLVIRNSPPSAFSLLFPSDTSILGVLPEFNWTTSEDADGDTVNYILQISTDSNFAYLNYNRTLSEEKDENVVLTSDEIHKYYWRVNATDGIDTITSDNTWTFNYSQWDITFNVTSAEFTGVELNNVDISSCTYSGFDQAGDTTNLYGPYNFPNGTWQCTFEVTTYFDKTRTFIADEDKIVDVTMSLAGKLTREEHTWLEALYNCIILKDCDLYDLLLQINETVGNTWQYVKPTDESVITSETEISNTLNSTQNITYDYTVNIPIKAGYSLGAYLPVRIGFWFMNESNESCYSQGTLPTGVTVIEPYCNPLMVQTIGPMGGSVDFTVDLRPNLAAGTYNVKRIIEIDPNEIWEGYGQEVIDTITVTEDMTNDGIVDLEKTSESMPDISSSSSSSSGGGSGSGSYSRLNPVLTESNSPTIIQNTYVNNNYGNNTYITENSDDTEEKTETKSSGFGSLITGAATRIAEGITSNLMTVAILVIICLILGGLFGNYYAKKKKK